MITAELAAGLPVLVLLLAFAVSVVHIAGARVRVADAAREAARAAARGDDAAARTLAQQYAVGSVVTITRGIEQVDAVAKLVVRPLGSWLPAITVGERAVAAIEPASGAPP